MCETLSGCLSAVLALTTGTILVLQYLLAKRQWRLNLYDKRYPVFLTTMQYLSYIGQNANLTQEELFKFLRNSKDKEFLFGSDVQDHLEELYKKGIELYTRNIVLEKEPVGDKRNELVDKQEKLLEWFSQQFDATKKLFGEYLAIDKK